jgi:hypothetical protein
MKLKNESKGMRKNKTHKNVTIHLFHVPKQPRMTVSMDEPLSFIPGEARQQM